MLFDQVFSNPKWRGHDVFPLNEEWKTEINKWSTFINDKKQLDRYIPRLTKQIATLRDEALAEIFAAFFMETQLNHEIIGWEPKTINGKDVDFIVNGKDAGQIYCEVKSPGWESELDWKGSKKNAINRKKLPKHISGEARSFATWETIRNSIKKAYEKFSDIHNNLLIIVDDLSVQILDWPQKVIDIALYEEHGCYDNEKGCFADNKYENLGEILFLNKNKRVANHKIEYRHQFCKNKNAKNKFNL